MASDTINRQIGARLRSRRRLLGLTQANVADACGVSFQQVQKYEGGMTTISAGMLWRVAQALVTDVGYFFEGSVGARAVSPGPRSEPGRDARGAPAAHGAA